MKLIITSDLHQRISKWDDLVPVVASERPRFLLIAGDILPKLVTFKQQRSFFAVMRQCFQDMKQIGPLTVLIYFGNDDPHVLEPLLDDLQAEGLCVNLNARIHREQGLVFCGMNKVRDYPFGYKHWCAPDDDYIVCPKQFCGEGLTIDEQGNWVPLPSLLQHMSAKTSISDELNQLKAQLASDEMRRSIWMVHQPPAGLGMDVLTDGQKVGSPALLNFIQQNQPLLGCSGHIHESPYQPGGQWVARAGETTWVQPGQMDRRLHFVSLEITKTLSVTRIRHSVFGVADLP